jgi:hypothetical protein
MYDGSHPLPGFISFHFEFETLADPVDRMRRLQQAEVLHNGKRGGESLSLEVKSLFETLSLGRFRIWNLTPEAEVEEEEPSGDRSSCVAWQKARSGGGQIQPVLICGVGEDEGGKMASRSPPSMLIPADRRNSRQTCASRVDIVLPV